MLCVARGGSPLAVLESEWKYPEQVAFHKIVADLFLGLNGRTGSNLGEVFAPSLI